MPEQSANGYAFEYAIIISIPEAINDWIAINQNGNCYCQIIEDQAFFNTKMHFNSRNPEIQQLMVRGAKAGLSKIIDMEPRLVYASSEDPLVIHSGTSQNGIVGDVRDIVFIRQLQRSHRRSILAPYVADGNPWEIGISAKWNNDVIKNSRLAEHLDFCNSWFGFPCSRDYWNDIAPVMAFLNDHAGQTWRSLPDKKNSVYRPLIDAFVREMNKQATNHNLANMLVEYMVGRYDFYKLMTSSSNRITNIQAFNLRGNLNQDCEGILPRITVPLQARTLPTRIVSIARYLDRPAWAEIIMDNGWQFSFRLHNAESLVVPSLKFDVRFRGNPMATWAEPWI